MRTHTPFHWCAASSGIALLVVEVGTHVDYMHAQTGTFWDATMAATIAVSLGTALGLSASYHALRQWQLVTSGLLFAAFLVGAAFALTATLDRVASLRDNQTANRWQTDATWKLLNAAVDAGRAGAEAECSAHRKTHARGQRCKDAETELGIRERRRDERQAQLDSLGQRVAALLPGVTPEQVRTYQPVLLPVALFSLGNLLLAFGLSGQRAHRFGLKVAPQAAIELKVDTFRQVFQRQHGRLPRPKEISDNLRISYAVAKRLHDRDT